MQKKLFKPAKRWKLVWTTIPFLNLDWYDDESYFNVITHVLSNRNPRSYISDLHLSISTEELLGHKVENAVDYAISHNAEYLHIVIFDDH